MAQLVPSDGKPLAFRVDDGMGKAGLDVAHRLAHVLPVEAFPRTFERIHQGEGQSLLDHRRGVAVSDTRKLVAAGERVEVGVVLLLREVQLRDVLAILLGRHAEDDLAAEPARSGDRLIEHLRAVGGADEKDVVARGAEDRNPQLETGAVEPDLARQKQAVQADVHEPPAHLLEVARVVDPVHQHEQRVQAQLAAAEHPSHATGSAAAHSTPARAEGVELVDEDDAAAPALGAALRCAHRHEHVEGVHAEEHALEGRAGRDDDRHVHRRSDAFRQHRLAGARRTDHEHAALALASGPDVVAALLHEGEDAAHLFDRGSLTPDVLDPHLVVGLAGVDVVAADAPINEEGAEEKHEVGDHDHEEVGKLRDRGGDQAGQRDQRVQRVKAVEEKRDEEVNGEESRHRSDTAPEQGPVGLECALVGIRLRRDPLAENQPSLEQREKPAADEHRDDGVNEGPRDAELQRDIRERKRGGANEDREDPEDDHGKSLYGLRFRTARNTTTARPMAITTSPMLYTSGTGYSAIQSPSRFRLVSGPITV